MLCDSIYVKYQNRQIHRDRKSTSICQGWGMREYGAIAKGYWVSFEGD